MNPWTLAIWVVITTLVVLWLWSILAGGTGDQPQIAYSTFRAELREGNVERVHVQGDRMEGELRESIERTLPSGETQRFNRFLTYIPSFQDDELMNMLESREVEVTTEPTSDFVWWPFLISGLPLILIIIIGYFIYRRMSARGGGQGLFNIGQNQAKLQEETDEKTSFDDVAGVEGAKVELQEVVSFLKDPERFEKFGAEIPKGVLLVGPPGTGKTLLARAVAGEAGVSFYTITGSDFMEMFVGVGASRVRNMFKDARENAPCIIFIDELDSIGRKRGAGMGGGHDEREQTLNQLLSELDGFEPTESVIVMAATNRPDILDPALLRPGRFDRQITVDAPALKDRIAILEIHAKNKPISDDVDLGEVARGTPGFSGADLKNLLNEGALLAARKEKEEVEREDLEEARDKIIMGLERSGVVLEGEEKRMVAYHEAGHALLAAMLPNTDPVHKVTIVPRGRAMGVTQQLPDREQYIYRREYMLDRIAVIMGGRAAEDVVFDTATSGAENDFQQSTKLARSMVLRWGMSERVGRMALDGSDGQIFLGEEMGKPREYSEQTARVADEEVRTILEDAYMRATTMLRENRAALDRLADVLIDKEEVMGEEVLELLGLPPRKKNGRVAAARQDNEDASDPAESEAKDSAGEDSAGEDSAGEDSAGEDSAGEDSANEDGAPQSSAAAAGDGVATEEPVPPSDDAPRTTSHDAASTEAAHDAADASADGDRGEEDASDASDQTPVDSEADDRRSS